MNRVHGWLLWQLWKNGGPRERLVRAIVWRLPREIIYWSAVRFMAHATTTGEGRTRTPDEVTMMDALKAWPK